MRVSENVALASFTTLRLGGPAARFALAESEDDVVAVVREVDARGEPLLVLGGGSNLVISDHGFAGTVLHIATRGRTVARADGEGKVHVTAAAGEPWDDLVGWAVGAGFAGIECLSGIPGLVGAVPMQNVGAYGQDVSETLVRLRAWDRVASRIVTIPREACGFAYRSSVFRGKDRHVILDVTFALDVAACARPIKYAELSKALGGGVGASHALGHVRDTVIALRRKKGMVLDPTDTDTASAGSFFTNPILDREAIAALRTRAASILAPNERMPEFPEPDGRTKVSAGWLIERAGFTKGRQLGRVAISSKHALALTNRGGATCDELVALAREVQRGVRERFGVTLENEPVTVGVAL